MNQQALEPSSGAQQRIGVVYAIAAYSWWGLSPAYFKLVAHVNAFEILAHRIVWAVVLLALLLAWRRQGAGALQVLRSRRAMLTLLVTAVLVGANWLTFIYGVVHDRILECSLGYYINPLVSVLMGRLFLGERLRPWQGMAVALALVGVGIATVAYGHFPWIALVLALTFACYGLLRKTAKVDALLAVTLDAGMLMVPAMIFVVFWGAAGKGQFGTAWPVSLLLVCAGPVTALPLLWFVNACRRLRLSTVGFLQYIGPSLNFLLAVFVYGEAFGRDRIVTFACIWIALAIYSFDTWRSTRQAPPIPEAV